MVSSVAQRILGAALGALLGLHGCATTSPGGAADPSTLQTIEGRSLGIDLDGPNRPVLLVFASDSCTPCRRDIDNTVRFAQELVGKVDVVGVLIDPSQIAAHAYVSDTNISYRIAWDPERRIAGRYGVQSAPALVLIDQSGSMVSRAAALTDTLRAAAREMARTVSADHAQTFNPQAERRISRAH